MLLKINGIIFCNIYFVIFINFCWSQNIAPKLTAIGNQGYCAKSQINIVTDFNIDDPDDTEIAALYIQISTGYVQGEDTLALIGTHPNISTSWSSTEGKLTLRGLNSLPANYIDLIAAVKEVVFQSTSVSPSNKEFSITIGDANYLPQTGHYYEYVSDFGITWTAAKAAAENRTYFGLKGYLATITSSEEAQLTGEQASGSGWIGGTDEETEGVWKWVTGPEAGTVFWNGAVNGSTPNYSNWNSNQPDNAHGGVGEDYIHITDPSIGNRGAWNDLRVGGDPTGLYHPKGYIVEYGGTPGDPVLNISASTQITVVNSLITNVKSNIRCGSGSLILEATASQGDVLWFDSPTGGTSIYSGDKFITQNINATRMYYVSSSFNGCINDERIPVEASVYQIPIIEPSVTFKNCDVDGILDGFTNFNLEEANSIITNNNLAGLDILYYTDFDEAHNGTLNSISTPSSFNNSIATTIYARVQNSNGCYAVSEITLEISTTTLPDGFLEELTFCDDGVNGINEFNLTDVSQKFLDRLPSGQNLSIHYFENLNDAQLEQNEILGIYENKDAFSQIIYVRVESDDNENCFGIGPHLQLTVHPRPEFEVDNSAIYCLDGNDITLTTFNPTGNFTYEWKDNTGQVVSNTPFAAVGSGGTYTVIATSISTCESFPKSFNVVESARANIDIDDISIIELTDNNSITINNDNNNLGIGDYEFSLDNIDGLYQEEPYFNGVSAGSHIVYVKDKNGCGITSIEVFILGFPKFFTPNNDGVNDTWQIKGLGTDYTNDSKVSIYNRYGKLIKQLTTKSGAWDGTFKDEPLPDSDYWFIAELVEVTGAVRVYRGHFSLIR